MVMARFVQWRTRNMRKAKGIFCNLGLLCRLDLLLGLLWQWLLPLYWTASMVTVKVKWLLRILGLFLSDGLWVKAIWWDWTSVYFNLQWSVVFGGHTIRHVSTSLFNLGHLSSMRAPQILFGRVFPSSLDCFLCWFWVPCFGLYFRRHSF